MNFIKEFVNTHRFERELALVLVGIIAGSHPILTLQVIGLAIMMGTIFLTVVLLFLATDGDEELDPGYIKAISKEK